MIDQLMVMYLNNIVALHDLIDSGLAKKLYDKKMIKKMIKKMRWMNRRERLAKR
jgi:hypothetical protein